MKNKIGDIFEDDYNGIFNLFMKDCIIPDINGKYHLNHYI